MKKAGMVNPVSKLTTSEIKKAEKAAGKGFKLVDYSTESKLSDSGLVQYFKLEMANDQGEDKTIDLAAFLSDRRSSYII